MRTKEDPWGARGMVEVKLVDNYNDQLVIAGCNTHLVQYDMTYNCHRKWNDQVSPVYLGALNEAQPTMMVTLHENGDLIFWKMAYRQKWSHFNVFDPTRRFKEVNADDASAVAKKHGGKHKSKKRGGKLEHKRSKSERKMNREGGAKIKCADRSGSRQSNASSKVGKSVKSVKATSESKQSHGSHRSGKVRKSSKPEDANQENAFPPFEALIFLKKNRFFSESIGNVLLVESRSEFVQCWNMFGFVNKFATTRDLDWCGFVTAAIVDDSERLVLSWFEKWICRENSHSKAMGT